MSWKIPAPDDFPELSPALRGRLFSRNFDFQSARTLIWPIRANIGDHIIDFELILALRKLLRTRGNRSEVVLCLDKDKQDFFGRFLAVAKIVHQFTNFEELNRIRAKYPPVDLSYMEGFNLYGWMPFGSMWDSRWAALGLPGRFTPAGLGAAAPKLSAALKKEGKDAKRIAGIKKPYLLFSPDANWNRDKEWPIECWHALLDRVEKELSFEVVVLLGTSKVPDWKDRSVRVYDYSGIEGSDFLRLLALIDGAKAVVTIDAGPAHAAGFIGKPAAVLFGETSPVIWGHRNNVNLRITTDLRKIRPDDVLRVLRDQLLAFATH